MKFRNINTGEIVEANTYTRVFAFSHNSNYIKLEEEKTSDEDKTKAKKNKKTSDEDKTKEEKDSLKENIQE